MPAAREKQRAEVFRAGFLRFSACPGAILGDPAILGCPDCNATHQPVQAGRLVGPPSEFSIGCIRPPAYSTRRDLPYAHTVFWASMRHAVWV